MEKLLPQIWDASPVLFAIVVFVLFVIALNRMGLINIKAKDPEDEKLKQELKELRDLGHKNETDISYIKGKLDL